MPAILDAPTETDVVDRFGFVARGWVWLGGEQAELAAVEAWSGGAKLGEADALTLRPDVCAALALVAEARTGFEIMAQHVALARGENFELQVRVRFRDGRRSEPLCGRTLRTLGGGEAPLAVAALPAPVANQSNVPQPPEHLQVRQVAGVWGEHYYREGRVILGQIAAAFRDAGRPLERAEAVLDFGCGCGRVLRNLEGLRAADGVWGCDIDAEAIAWNRQNLAHLGRFEINPVVPPSPFAGGQFDAVYSVSVFTHLPEELQFAWLTELRRIVRPGGILVISVHGAHYWSHGDSALRAEVIARGFAYRLGPPTAGLPDFYMVAFHSEAYLRPKWGRFFEVLAVREKLIHGVHDAVILRRPRD